MKVFISSTYIDLVEHRKAAHDALERIGQEVGRMEIFGARADEAKTVALDELEKSDLVVGIYAYRYGFIPDGADISITEQEFVHAKSKNIPVLCFVVNEDEPWPPKMMEKGPAKIKKLDDFKAKVLKEKVVDFFTSPTDLGLKIATSVHNYIFQHHSELSKTPTPAISRRSTLPYQPYFFGREIELAIIADAISPESRTWGALIDGPGGIGKTALAVRAAYLAPTTLFEQKIFITSKIRELTPTGEKSLVDFTRPDYLSILNELALELRETGISKLPENERADALRLALSNKHNLIIFDNLETIKEDERSRLFQLLSRLPIGNKAIVTSRRRSDVDARIVRLDRLSLKDSLKLIGELAKNNRYLDQNKKDWHDLYGITNGNPLLIKWIAGQFGREGSMCRTIAEAFGFIEKAPKNNDPLEYIFGDLVETFTNNENVILSTLVHFSYPISINSLVHITHIPAPSVQTTVEDLIDRAILIGDPQTKMLFLPPLTAKFLRRAKPDFIKQSASAIVSKATEIIFAADGKHNEIINLELEWPLISASIPFLLRGSYKQLLSLCKPLDMFFEFSGRWAEWINFNLKVEETAIKSGDYLNAGWRALNTGWAYYLLRQPDNVLTSGLRAAAHWAKAKAGEFEKANALRLLGTAYQLKQDYKTAAVSFYNALGIQMKIAQGSKDVATSLNDLAEVERLTGDYEAAERDYKGALEIAQGLMDREGIAIYKSNYAELALARKQWNEAENYASEALEVSTNEIGRQELIAICCRRMAEALIEQARFEDSLSYAQKAVGIYKQIHSPELAKAQAVLNLCQEKLQH